jgi:hypothetical protein
MPTRAYFPIAAALLLSSPALATDGVLEINQTCAVETGCFAADAPGLPVTIHRDQPGSYRLTSNLTSDDPAVSIIEVYDAHARIDLNGFTLSGPASCSGFGPTLTCSPPGSGRGVTVVPASEVPGVQVRNGVVRGMASSGITLGPEARVEDVLVVSNGVLGISVASRSHVSECQVLRNGASGIASTTSSLRANEIAGNRIAGVSAENGGIVERNVINGNGSYPIKTDNFPNSGGVLVVDNTVTGNADLASLDATDSYARNNFRGNGSGAQVSGGVNAGGNVCNGSLTCP